MVIPFPSLFLHFRPDEILEPPVSSDALRPAWLVGFDGAIWDGAKMEPWNKTNKTTWPFERLVKMQP